MSERKTKTRRRLSVEIGKLHTELGLALHAGDQRAAVKLAHNANRLYGAIEGVSQHRQRQRARRAWKSASARSAAS